MRKKEEKTGHGQTFTKKKILIKTTIVLHSPTKNKKENEIFFLIVSYCVFFFFINSLCVQIR